MRLKQTILAALALVLSASAAFPQATILQGGPSTVGHAPAYVSQGNGQPVVVDSGPAGGGGNGVGLSEELIVARGTGTPPYAGQGTGPLGTIKCLYDAPIVNATGYHYLCFSPNAQGGALVVVGNGGGATALPLAFNVNGVSYTFPFSISGIVGPGSSVINDAACWNNTVGTLLKDCGAFVTVGGTNVWTGLNNFTGTFQIGGVTQTFPPSGAIVGASDVQTLTNKSINAAQVNSGTLPGVVMPAFSGDVSSPAGSPITTISANAVTNAKLAAASAANTVKGAATATAIADLAVPSCSASGNALQWVAGTGFQCASIGANSAGFGLALAGGSFSISSTQPPYPFDEPVNMALTASVGSNALTINMVGANGSALSATNPVLAPFRSTTIAGGAPVWTAITTATTLTVPNGAALGTSNNVPFRVWIFLTYNSGAPQLGVAVCSAATTIYPCTGWQTSLKTTITLNSSSGSAGVLYVPSGVSNDSVRIIGYAEFASGLTTAGTWASAPTQLQLFGPGIAKPGDVVQTIVSSTTTPGTTTSATFAALATGQSQAITPTSSVNFIRVFAEGSMSAGSANNVFLQLARGSTLIGNPALISPTAFLGAPTSIIAYDAPGVTTLTTYGFQGKTVGGSTLTYPISATGAILELQEIMGALEPANDNDRVPANRAKFG